MSRDNSSSVMIIQRILEKTITDLVHLLVTDIIRSPIVRGLQTTYATIDFGAIYDHETQSSIVYIKPKYQITDALSADLQLIIIDGTEKSLLSFFRKSDSASLGLTYLF